MYCSFPILFSCYTFHEIVIYYAFHLILSYTFRVIDTLFLVLVYLSYTFLFHILYCSYTFHVLYFLYTVILYFTSCSCNCLYFHRIAVLCFSYHIFFIYICMFLFYLSYTLCFRILSVVWRYPQVLQRLIRGTFRSLLLFFVPSLIIYLFDYLDQS